MMASVSSMRVYPLVACGLLLFACEDSADGLGRLVPIDATVDGGADSTLEAGVVADAEVPEPADSGMTDTGPITIDADPLEFSERVTFVAANPETNELYLADGETLVALNVAQQEVRRLSEAFRFGFTFPAFVVGPSLIYLESVLNSTSVVIDRGPGQTPLRMPGDAYAVGHDSVVVDTGSETIRVNIANGEQRTLPGRSPALSWRPGTGRVVVIEERGANPARWLYDGVADTITELPQGRLQVFNDGASIQPDTGNSVLFTGTGQRALPFASHFGVADIVCGIADNRVFVVPVGQPDDTIQADLNAPVGFIPGERGCAFLLEQDGITWLDLDGEVVVAAETSSTPWAFFDIGLAVIDGPQPYYLNPATGIVALDARLPVAMIINGQAFVRDGRHFIQIVTGADRLLSSFAIDPVTGNALPITFEGFLSRAQPGTGPWLGASDMGFFPEPTLTPYAINADTGEVRSLSSEPIPIAAISPPGAGSDFVFTLGNYATYFERITRQGTVRLRATVVDL